MYLFKYILHTCTYIQPSEIPFPSHAQEVDADLGSEYAEVAHPAVPGGCSGPGGPGGSGPYATTNLVATTASGSRMQPGKVRSGCTRWGP